MNAPFYRPSYSECLASHHDFVIPIELDDHSQGQAVYSVAGCSTDDDGAFIALLLEVRYEGAICENLNPQQIPFCAAQISSSCIQSMHDIQRQQGGMHIHL